MITYKFKLYNDEDNKNLHEILNTAGNIYNHCIELHKLYYAIYHKHLHKYSLQKHLAKCKQRGFSYWKKVGSTAIIQITERIDEAYKRFFKNLEKKSGRKVSPPSFQKVRKYKSVTYKNAGYKFLEDNVVIIQKRRYRYFRDRNIEGKIKIMTLKRTPLGEFFITVVTDHVATGGTENTERNAVGVDFGLKTFLTLSTGERVESPLFFKQSLKNLRKANKSLSSKKKGSKNRERARKNLARVHEKIANQREAWFWKISKDLCEKFDVIAHEDLNLSGMKKMWGRKINDLGFSTFLRILECQASKHKTKIVPVDRFFPSSKICFECGKVNESLELKEREWVCSCGAEHDRDLNASKNILKEGLHLLAGEV